MRNAQGSPESSAELGEHRSTARSARQDRQAEPPPDSSSEPPASFPHPLSILLIDIATLTGSCARALGDQIAGVLGNHQGLVGMVEKASESTGELVWQLPLHRPYREILDSGVADLQNCGPIGKPDAILASLYLSEFVGDVPWAHIDIAGTAWNDVDRSYQLKGSAGFGARLLLELATTFVPPVRGH